MFPSLMLISSDLCILFSHDPILSIIHLVFACTFVCHVDGTTSNLKRDPWSQAFKSSLDNLLDDFWGSGSTDKKPKLQTRSKSADVWAGRSFGTTKTNVALKPLSLPMYDEVPADLGTYFYFIFIFILF